MYMCIYTYIYIHLKYTHICMGHERCAESYRVAKTQELQVVFRKRATNHRALLRKMTYEDKAHYASPPPCIVFCHHLQTV